MLAGLVFAIGCSDMQPLSGTVTFSDDGSPVTAGAIFFETPTFSAQGTIRSDGTYVVGSMAKADGIPKGTYSVTVRGAEEITTTERSDGTTTERRRALIDPKYQNSETSGLTFTVDGKTKKFDFQVDRAR